MFVISEEPETKRMRIDRYSVELLSLSTIADASQPVIESLGTSRARKFDDQSAAGGGRERNSIASDTELDKREKRWMEEARLFFDLHVSSRN